MKRKRKGRGKNKPVTDEAGYLAGAIDMTSQVRKLQSQPSKFRHTLSGEDEAKTRLWEFAVAGKSLSEIDSVLAKMRRANTRRERSKLDKLVWEAWINLHAPAKYDPTHDEIIAEFCRITGKERTDSIASAVRRSVTRRLLRITRIRKSKLKNTK